jgi:peptide/nickel transport system substrate-binding protein
MTPAKRRAATLLASLTLATAAIGGSAVAQSPAAGQPGGTIVMGEWQAASQLHPLFTNAFADTEALTPSWRGLYTINNDGDWVPDLAASDIPSIENGNLIPDADGDGFQVKVDIKPGLKWSDGQPITLNDVAYMWTLANEVAKAGVGCTVCVQYDPLIDGTLTGDALLADDNRLIESWDVAEDGLTATVTFKHNFAGWLGPVGAVFLPQHFFSGMSPQDQSTVMSVGTDTLTTVPANGPFVITAASADGIDYARNENWTNTAPPLLDQLRFRFFGSKDGMITAFLNGEIDLALNMTQADYPAIEGVDPSIGRADLDSVWQYEHLDLNTTRPGLDDVNVRTAVAMAIDKADLISVLFPGTELEPACSQAPPGTWWRAEVECPPFDVDGANALLDQAGWLVNPDTGLREKDGVALRFQMCTSSGNPTRLTTVGKVNQYLNAIGIPSDIQTADATSVYFASWADTTPETQCSIYRGTYDVALFAYIIGGDLYSNYFFTYHTSQIPPAGNNTTRISDPALDASLEALGKEIDQAAQLEAAKTMQETLASVVAEIPLYYRAEATGVSNHLGGYVRFNPSSAGPTWDVEQWHFIP